MAYTFDPISSYAADGKRDIQVDCTPILEPLELVSSATATSLDTTILTISTAAAVNTTVLTKDDGMSTIAIGKGVTLGITTARKTTALPCVLTMRWSPAIADLATIQRCGADSHAAMRIKQPHPPRESIQTTGF